MDYRHGSKMRMNVEEGDTLSSLPDDLIHKILSYINIRDSIRTSVLSSRWRFLWTSLPYLSFSAADFSTLPKFSKFVTNVLSHLKNYNESLKHLSLTMHHYGSSCLTSTWELPKLTTLDLDSVTLRDDKDISLFSKCENLKDLTLTHFVSVGSNGFNICHPRLSNLTLKSCLSVKGIKVVAPQLKNLTIRSSYAEHTISAPNLAYLFYKGSDPLRLSTDGFRDLKNANICISTPRDTDAHQIICLLQELHNVTFLSLNLEIVEILSSSVHVILQQPSPFLNLKSLKIYPEIEVIYGKKVTIMSSELKSYLLGSSPGCTFTMVTREEIQVQILMSELQMHLKKENNNNNLKTNSAHLDVEKHASKKQEHGDKMEQIKSHWENLVVQIEQNKRKACHIVSKLQCIEKSLTKLPASKRAEIQPCFSTLCAEAHIAITKLTDSVKIQCDENQSRSSVCFHELATTVDPSS